ELPTAHVKPIVLRNETWSLAGKFLPSSIAKKGGFCERKWIVDEVNEWSKSSRSRHQMLMLIVGVQGAGKSEIAWHLASKEQVLAYHFCNMDVEETLTATNFVRNLAYNLAQRIPDYKNSLAKPEFQQFVAQLNDDRTDASAILYFRKIISDPLRGLERPKA